ncbi:MAG: hypothetical protein QNJ62_04970 [Methyloceanibacter sp.]|nr:hypothetical protein [Methyloceanibacter sp.]
MTDSVIQASYHEFKMVKTRSALQLILEVPIERAEHVFQVLGFPQPGQEQPVAIALLKAGTKPQNEPDKPPRRSWYDMPPSQRCAMLGEERAFPRYLAEVHGAVAPEHEGFSPQAIARWFRAYCRIQSRSELDALDSDDPSLKAFLRLETQYRQWAGLEAAPEQQPDTTRQAMKDLQRLGQEADAEQEQGADKAQHAPNTSALSVVESVKLALDLCHTPEELKDTAQRNQGEVERVCTAEEKKQLTAHYRARLAEMRG